MTAVAKFNLGDLIRDTKRNQRFRIQRIRIEQWTEGLGGQVHYLVEYRGADHKTSWCAEKYASLICANEYAVPAPAEFVEKEASA